MGIFDIFTGAPAKNAAASNQALLRFVSDRNRADITGAADTGAGYLNTGIKDALGYLGHAGAPLSSLAEKYGGATTLGLNALGVNGQPGIDAARGAFTASPGYDFNLKQGLEAINRRRAAGGMLDSGNADRDAQEYGAGLASREYGDWISRLLGFTNPELSANVAGAGLTRDMANVSARGGESLANLYTNAANARSGGDLALAGPYTKQTSDAAGAELTGSKNLWGLGMAAAQTAAGMPGLNFFGGSSGPSAANTGLSGGGYYDGSGNLAAGPGYYGPDRPTNWLSKFWA